MDPSVNNVTKLEKKRTQEIIFTNDIIHGRSFLKGEKINEGNTILRILKSLNQNKSREIK